MDFSNSFYYFFSATPQVLAAILGLFGVLVVFKIQSSKSNLIGFGQSVLDVIEFEINRDQILIKGVLNSKVKRAIKVSVYMLDIEGNGRNIQSIELKHETIDNIKDSFRLQKDILDRLIHSIVNLSILTTIQIVLCLAVLPFGGFILKHPVILLTLFLFVIGETIYNLWGFLKLLRITLDTWAVI